MNPGFRRERAYTRPRQCYICRFLLNIIVVRGITDTTFCVRPCVHISRASAHCMALFLFGFLRKVRIRSDTFSEVADKPPHRKTAGKPGIWREELWGVQAAWQNVTTGRSHVCDPTGNNAWPSPKELGHHWHPPVEESGCERRTVGPTLGSALRGQSGMVSNAR